MTPPTTTACYLCTEILTDGDSEIQVFCSVCKRRSHARCARSSSGWPVDVSSTPFVWTCDDCKSCSRSSLQINNDHFRAIMDQFAILSNSMATCNNRIEDLSATLSAQSLTLASCLEDISSLHSENRELRGEITALEDKLNNQFHLSSEEVVIESSERIKREKNVLIMGIPENTASEDLGYAKNLLLHIAPDSAEQIVSGIRLGKIIELNKPRPFRLTFSSSEVALEVLRNKSNITRNTHPSITIKSDMTPNQLQHLKNLREELELRSQVENNLTINT
ncbi:unnamed protein product [Phaedon cochleariae]|uniref:PHD-type domain-containing protein n=1 Tax=Phaedon cochleariae TaxID=80249 RepID=A0A9N9SAC5_PHACE|nr:unnamed protein product [Phaedon cochleariae]